MEKKRTYMFSFFILTIAFFGLAVSESPALPLNLPAERTTINTEVITVQAEPIERPDVEYTADSQRDPFRSLIVEAKGTGQDESYVPGGEELPTLTVQGLVWGGKFPQAIINNKVVKIGDIIEGAQVANIEKGGVRLLFKGKNYSLSSPASGVAQSE